MCRRRWRCIGKRGWATYLETVDRHIWRRGDVAGGAGDGGEFGDLCSALSDLLDWRVPLVDLAGGAGGAAAGAVGARKKGSIVDYLLSVFLGVVEGLTDFIPVSSTAHLRICKRLFHLHLETPYWKMYTVVIQLGAVLCLPVYFRPEIK